MSLRVIRTVSELRKWRAAQTSLGFVPTMGALHDGHIHLLKQSLQNNRSTLLSIFVNPSQFSPTEDLQTYPRTFDDDVRKFTELAETAQIPENDPTHTFPAQLRAESQDSEQLKRDAQDRLAVFAPTVAEMYPSGITLDPKEQRGTFVEVLGSSHQLEGAVRPHFFRGVATVVSKLLNAAQANVAYFGQKDIQQTVVVRNLVRDLLIPTRIEVCETRREPNGLAMSSRNAYLSPEERERASVIYQALSSAKTQFLSGGTTASRELIESVESKLKGSPLIAQIEYVSINDLNTFEVLEHPKKGESVLSTAVRLHSGIRLLDNVLL